MELLALIRIFPPAAVTPANAGIQKVARSAMVFCGKKWTALRVVFGRQDAAPTIPTFAGKKKRRPDVRVFYLTQRLCRNA
jgi:hypothetical protein